MAEQQKKDENKPKYEVSDNNGGVSSGGVVQIGEFDPEKQKKDREEAAKKAEGDDSGAELNANDPALPTVDKSNLKKSENEGSDRDKHGNPKKD